MAQPVTILRLTLVTMMFLVISLEAFKLPEDVSVITWAHAVNSRDELDTALDSEISFLEADISMGFIRRKDNLSPVREPIMAHPPLTTSDISLSEWIAEVVERSNGTKGVKLDFKSTDAANASLEILNKWRDKITFPLWLNADILPGPVDAARTPVDANTFILSSRQFFPNATLSIGWTTEIIADEDNYRYTWNHVWQMVKTIRCLEVDGLQPITFPIRALFVKNSMPQLLWLVNMVLDSSITVWSSKFDAVDVTSLIELRKSLQFSQVYYDLPKKLDDKFNALKSNVSYDPSIVPFNNWGVLRDTTEPFGCEDETLVSGNTVVYGGDRTVAVFNESPVRRNANITGKLYPYALPDFAGNFSEREGAMAVILAASRNFWSDGHWKTWQNLTSLAIGTLSPNHSQSCCSIDFKLKTIMPEGGLEHDVQLRPCHDREACLVYQDSTEFNLSGLNEFYLGFVFMGERAMILDEITVNGVSDYFVAPVIASASGLLITNLLTTALLTLILIHASVY